MVGGRSLSPSAAAIRGVLPCLRLALTSSLETQGCGHVYDEVVQNELLSLILPPAA